MNVLHVIGSLDPRMGGLPRAVVGLAAAQARSGTTVSVLFSGAPLSDEAILEWIASDEIPPKLTFRSVPRIRVGFGSTFFQKVLASEKPDWIQVHGLWEPLLHATMRWANRKHIPYGVSPHSMGHPWHHHKYARIKRIISQGFGVNSLWENASCLHALTPVEATHWEPLLGERISVIPNGIDPSSDPGCPETSSSLLPEKPFVLFLGRLHEQKAPEVLLEAFLSIAGKNPDLDLVLAGPDYGLGRTLKESAEKAGVAGRVHFAGMLEGAEKWEALHRCVAFCLPSRAEGFSLAVLEACLAGAPCLISEECGFPDLVQSGGAVEIPVESNGLSESLSSVVLNPEASREMGERARKLVVTSYTWEAAADRFEDMVQRWA